MSMANKKAQLSMNVIVYVAIALLVLVLIVAFTTGGLGNLFKGLSTTGPGELDTIKNKCLTSCEDAKTKVGLTGSNAWSISAYCSEKYGYDANKDGTTEADEFIHCWENPLGVDCSTTVAAADEPITLDQDSC